MNPTTNQPCSVINGVPSNQLFPIGRLLATPGAIDLLAERGLSTFEFVSRHRQGDWGDLDDEDVQANRAALIHGSRLLSSYQLDANTRLWIITEADRSATTLLLPSEY
ncbi:MAG: hypothetical protein WC073_03910 [Sterolibacterium sp.]